MSVIPEDLKPFLIISGLAFKYSSSSISHLAPRGFMILNFNSTG